MPTSKASRDLVTWLNNTGGVGWQLGDPLCHCKSSKLLVSV